MKSLTILLISILPLLLTAQTDKNKKVEIALKSIKFTSQLKTFATQKEITKKTGDLKAELSKSSTVAKKENVLEGALTPAKKDGGLFISLVGVAVYDKKFPVDSIIRVILSVLGKDKGVVAVEVAELLATYFPENEAIISKELSKVFPMSEKDIIAAVERGVKNSGSGSNEQGQAGTTNEGNVQGQPATVTTASTNTPVIVVPAEDVNQDRNSGDGT